ncbi:hypothetical protein [Lentzea sp. NBRC 102530]|uniref:hypothetical protein n=1 Tax=Lentzea sp. NBRC 102530 TaxID=3032201 RepID=UPI0024A178AC|nr:hypothetical protein [Lentzea sp. NBRC 102530]GLY48226.1 hypothetical protein Lesp01_18820 [Lentzea sp. NBRC 102530]
MLPQERQVVGAVVELPDGSWWDWDVVSCDAGELRLGAGHDLTYSHGLELVFSDPLFVQCPTAFQDPVFRAPRPDEIEAVTRRFGEAPGILVSFEAEAGGVEPVTCLVAAGGVEVVQGTVFRYWRGALEPGERHAPRVRSPGQQ